MKFRINLLLLAILLVPKLSLCWSNNNPFPSYFFVENKDQFRSGYLNSGPVRFGIDATDQYLFTDRGFIYRLMKRKSKSELNKKEDEEKESESNKDRVTSEELYDEIFVELVGANKVAVEAIEPLPNRMTYALLDAPGAKPRGVSAACYNGLIYKNIYNGIDLICKSVKDKIGFEYNFIIHPGADPNVIKISYHGEIKKMRKSRNGLLEISGPKITVTESAPKAFQSNQIVCKSLLEGNSVGFVFPNGFDSNKELIIDPFVTTNLSSLTINNTAYDVDYDYNGNLFVFGGGDVIAQSTAYKVSKYNSAGILQWTFNGVVPSQNWTNIGNAQALGQTNTFAGNFLVERSTGKVYVSEGVNSNGASTIRIDSNGVYDNFITAINPSYLETWDLAFDCITGKIYACGGGWTTNINFGLIDPMTASVSSSNITSLNNCVGQDVVNAALDNNSNLFVIFPNGNCPSVSNLIYKVNATRNGFVWQAPSGYSVLQEAFNKPRILQYFSNGTNILSVNDYYLFYYDGTHLKAFDKSNGSSVGTAITFPANTPLWQVGIAADNCNNIYIGTNGSVECYNFNGSAFNYLGTINLNIGGLPSPVYDIRYDPSTNLLYVAGENFAGCYTATYSTNCINIPIVGTALVTASGSCNGTAAAAVNTNLTGLNFAYIWRDSLGQIIDTHVSTNPIDSISSLSNGSYTVEVQINPLCGGPRAVDTVVVGNLQVNTSINDVSCYGLTDGSASVSVINGGIGPYSYLWNTNPLQQSATATQLGAGTYQCTVSDISGCSSSITATILEPLALSTSIQTSSPTCFGTNDGTANIIITGGTAPYSVLWSNGQTGLINDSLLAGSYSVQIEDSAGCLQSDSIHLINPLPPIFTVSANQSEICPGETASLTAIGVQSYVWSTGDTSSTIIISPSSNPTLYSVIGTDVNGCTNSQQVSIGLKPLPQLSILADTSCVNSPFQPNYSSSIASGTINSLSWNFGDGNTASGNNPSHIYAIDGQYTITATALSDAGCTAVDSTSITIINKPIQNISIGTITGCAPLSISINDNTIDYFGNPVSSTWTFDNSLTTNQSTFSTTINDSGTYSLELKSTDQAGCASDTSLSNIINVYPRPVSDFSISNTPLTDLRPFARFINTSSGGAYWQWNLGDGTVTNDFETSHTYQGPGIYPVTLITLSTYGCVDSITRNVEYILETFFYLPNTFTPNGDGINELFVPTYKNITNYQLDIFDQWGEKIFASDRPEKGWDGRYKDREVQSDVYVYTVRYKDSQGKTITSEGKVNVLR